MITRKDGFGKVCLEEKDLIKSIQNIIDNNFIVEDKYLNRMKEFFIFKDGKCSERIYNELKIKDSASEHISDSCAK